MAMSLSRMPMRNSMKHLPHNKHFKKALGKLKLNSMPRYTRLNKILRISIEASIDSMT